MSTYAGKNVAVLVNGTTYAATLLTEFKPNEVKAAKIDTTTYGSTAEEFIPSPIPSNGEVKLKLIFDPAAKPPVGVQGTVKIQYTFSGVQDTGSGFIESLSPEVPLNKLATAEATIVWSGPIVQWPV